MASAYRHLLLGREGFLVLGWNVGSTLVDSIKGLIADKNQQLLEVSPRNKFSASNRSSVAVCERVHNAGRPMLALVVVWDGAVPNAGVAPRQERPIKPSVQYAHVARRSRTMHLRQLRVYRYRAKTPASVSYRVEAAMSVACLHISKC
jgi:hypothetical protein